MDDSQHKNTTDKKNKGVKCDKNDQDNNWSQYFEWNTVIIVLLVIVGLLCLCNLASTVVSLNSSMQANHDGNTFRKHNIVKSGGGGGGGNNSNASVSPLLQSDLPSPLLLSPKFQQFDNSREQDEFYLKLQTSLPPIVRGFEQDSEQPQPHNSHHQMRSSYHLLKAGMQRNSGHIHT